MTNITRQRASDERAVTAPYLALKAASHPLQSPTIHTSESNALSHENTATLLSLPVQTTKNTRYIQETSSPHPLTLRKTVTQLSLPVIQTAPQPHHIQHTYNDPQRHTYIPLTHTPQRTCPFNPTIGEEVTNRDSTTREKRKPRSNPHKLTVPKRTKLTTHTSPTTTSPETCTPAKNSTLNTMHTRESQPPP